MSFKLVLRVVIMMGIIITEDFDEALFLCLCNTALLFAPAF